MLIQSILKLTGGAYLQIDLISKNIALLPSWMAYGMFRGKIGQRKAVKAELMPCKIIDFAKKLTSNADVDIFAVPKSILEFQKNSISYSEKDLDFIGGLLGIVKLGTVDFFSFSQKWIDLSLSPFLLCQKQSLHGNSMGLFVFECQFSNGQSRLALLSDMSFDGFLMRFLLPEISWPLSSITNEGINYLHLNLIC